VTDTQPREFNFFETLFGQQSASISQQAESQLYPYPMSSSQQAGTQQS